MLAAGAWDRTWECWLPRSGDTVRTDGAGGVCCSNLGPAPGAACTTPAALWGGGSLPFPGACWWPGSCAAGCAAAALMCGAALSAAGSALDSATDTGSLGDRNDSTANMGSVNLTVPFLSEAGPPAHGYACEKSRVPARLEYQHSQPCKNANKANAAIKQIMHRKLNTRHTCWLGGRRLGSVRKAGCNGTEQLQAILSCSRIIN